MDGWSIDYDSLERMDEPANVEFLFRIGRATGRKAVADPRLFPPRFDLGAGPLRVGLVGHRMNVLRTEHLEALTAEVRTVLHRVAAVVAERRRPLGGSPPEPHALVTVVTPLAEGADRIGARVATESGYGLACALPFVQEEYERDFASDASLAEFRALLEAADSWWELRGNRARRPEAYEAVGRAVLEHSDMLVAIWDGEPSRGRGGTADVVRAAAATMPVVWIHADPSRPTRVLTGLDGDALIQGAESEIGRLIAGLV